MSKRIYYVAYFPDDRAFDERIIGYVVLKQEAMRLVERLFEETGDNGYYWDELNFIEDFEQLIMEEVG